MSKLAAVSQDSARAGLMRRASAELAVGERLDLPDFIMDFTSLMPNKSPEPTAVTPTAEFASGFGWLDVTHRRWLSFFR
jgi:hypothetical protein